MSDRDVFCFWRFQEHSRGFLWSIVDSGVKEYKEMSKESVRTETIVFMGNNSELFHRVNWHSIKSH